MFLFLADPPDISVEKSWVHSGEGFEAQLVCIVYADPQPTVSNSRLDSLKSLFCFCQHPPPSTCYCIIEPKQSGKSTLIEIPWKHRPE